MFDSAVQPCRGLKQLWAELDESSFFTVLGMPFSTICFSIKEKVSRRPTIQTAALKLLTLLPSSSLVTRKHPVFFIKVKGFRITSTYI